MAQNIKKYKSYIIIAVITLLISAVGFTVAYFQAQIGSGVSANVSVTSKSTDLLTFSKGNSITINATQSNFYNGAGNLTGTTTATATLLANNDTNSATQTYNVYFNITSNNYEYTTAPTNTPELLLTITDPNNQAVTSITGLTYTTVNGVSGFDITEETGLIQIARNYSITSNSSTTVTNQTWNITVTLINLNSDQQENTNKSLTAQAIIQKGAMGPLLADVVKNSWTTNSADSIIIKHDGTVLDDDNNIIDAEDNSYRYTGGEYDVTQQAISAGYNYVNTYYENTTDGVIGYNCAGTNYYIGTNLCSQGYNYYYLLYDASVTEYSTYEAAAEQAINDGYLIKKNLNNYVCFGYDTSVPNNETTCPEQNLYRIIGAFDDDNDGNYNVKLIKADYASTSEMGTNDQNNTTSYVSNLSSYKYNGYRGSQNNIDNFRWWGRSATSNVYTNRWNASTFRTGVLNGYYLNTYLNGNDTKWKNMLEETTYYLGGRGKKGYNYLIAKNLYNFERDAASLDNSNATYVPSIENYIGLMYISDYSYAGKINTWTLSIQIRVRSSGNDWLYSGINEWVITPYHSSKYVICITHEGHEGWNSGSDGKTVRPVMYLKSSVKAISGVGTKADPYRLEI